jgi:hypothetical protein
VDEVVGAHPVDVLAAAGLVDAVADWHMSALRQAVAPRIAGLVPYVYTASYEGGERTPEMFLTGEIPSRQLLPAMQWLNREHGRGCAALARRRGDHAPRERRRG